MKKVVLVICLVSFFIEAFAQNTPKERVKTFKIAYISEKLDLTSKEAQLFWPIYNDHKEAIKKIRVQERKLFKAIKESDNGEALSNRTTESFLNNYLNAEEQKFEARKKLIIDLKNVISDKKILKLIKAEGDFHKRMLDRIKNRRKKH
ncbi:hypothetical protein [Aquimarina longa]|uniref:hypothetical protein n=1 Tax=Aquimarina longa TaxID=1080221 RepID=UPI000781285B|nr:hypothetical protein [Aquimarina longa]